MLAYLEDLCGALIAHDAGAIQRLLAHPLARSLPRQVREEAIAISRASSTSLRAPIQTLRFYHQTLQLGAPQHDSRLDESAASDSGDTDPDRVANGAALLTAAHPPAALPAGALPAGAHPAGAHPAGAHPADPAARDPHRHATTTPGHSAPRDQIELPLDLSPRTAQAA